MSVIVDGVVCIYQNFNQLVDVVDGDPVKMVSAFHAMPSLIFILFYLYLCFVSVGVFPMSEITYKI